jgi:hypothetical protein
LIPVFIFCVMSNRLFFCLPPHPLCSLPFLGLSQLGGLVKIV